MRCQARSDGDLAGPAPAHLLRLGSCAAALLLLAACASTPLQRAPAFEFFAPADPQVDPWYGKIEDWQTRALEQGQVPIEAERASLLMRRRKPLDDKIAAFVGTERMPLAKTIARWTREEGRRHYRSDPDPTLAGDHWPTYQELTERNGDDCDGLDLIAYRLLVEFGFPRDQLFRGVIRRNLDNKNHMVTLWFEDPKDPWVFDGTGALTRRLIRFSEIENWTPVAVFNERQQFSVVESGLAAGASAGR